MVCEKLIHFSGDTGCVHIYENIPSNLRTRTCMHARTQSHVRTHTHVNMQTCIYTCMHLTFS